MAKSYSSAVIPASADDVWAVVRDFNGLAGWVPAITSSEIEGGGSPEAVGAIRKLTTGDGGVVREKLVVLDDADRSYTYDILSSPFPVRTYRATIHVLPITDTGQAFVEWYSVWDADASDEAELHTTFAQGIYASGLESLRKHFS